MKKLLLAVSLFAGLLLPAYGQTILTQTTLAAAVTSSTTTIPLTSSTGLTATSSWIYVDQELIAVNSVLSSTSISGTRGQQGTNGKSHLSGAVVFIIPKANASYSNDPQGSCTRANELFLPHINPKTRNISDCVGGVWVVGTNNLLQVTPTFVYGANPGGTIYTSLDSTGTAPSATVMNCVEVDLPFNKNLTGIAILNGTSVATDKHLVALYDSAGNLLANSAVAGTLSLGSASEYGLISFTSKYFAVGPAAYFACMQSNGTTATVRMLRTQVQDNYLTKGVTGQTFGTIPATFTVPTTFTTGVGPYVQLQ